MYYKKLNIFDTHASFCILYISDLYHFTKSAPKYITYNGFAHAGLTVWLNTENNLFSRKQLFLAKTIHHKRPKPPAMTKVLQNTFTYQIWIQSDIKWWLCNTFCISWKQHGEHLKMWSKSFKSDLSPVVYSMTVSI